MFDLARDLPTTRADVEALRRLRAPAAPPADWLERLTALSSFGGPPAARPVTVAGRRPFTL